MGCYYEFYGKQAVFANKYLNLKFAAPRNYLGKKTGFPIKYIKKNIDLLINEKIQLVVINEKKVRITNVIERKLDYMVLNESFKERETNEKSNSSDYDFTYNIIM